MPRDGLDHAPESRVRPDDRRLGMAREQSLHLLEVGAHLLGLAERLVDVVVDDDDQADLTREVEDAVERRVGQARDVAGNLRGHELLVDRELTDPGEHAGKGLEHPPDVIGRVHVGGVEAGDHRIEAGLLLRRQRLVGHRDVGVREGVVVEVRVAIEVILRRVVARDAVRPLLAAAGFRTARRARRASP